ncbi:3160_t:CDS:2 [Dentiscutata erythropus]|uniref:3160_t:CDS:1 n=1 Tax=Dentiscutata erythropus TaxID=1348616 RepID=A0A9N8WER8_9GLOM|nr:3160_t:CDS:2 [Dentiscutata erythropus]
MPAILNTDFIVILMFSRNNNGKYKCMSSSQKVGSVKYENIVKVSGLTNDNRSYRELTNYDNLRNYLRRYSLIPWEEKVTLLWQTIGGRKYLIDNSVPIELEPKNIFIHDSILKITNIVDNVHDDFQLIRYISPESFSNEKTKSDIYSFGILLWEIFSSIKLFQEDYNILYTIKSARKSSLKNVDLYKLCLLDDLDKRSSWNRIVKGLENISVGQNYIENAGYENKHTRFDKNFLILSDFNSLENVKKRQIIESFKLNKGCNRDGFNFNNAKKDIFENIELTSDKVEFIPIVYFASINVEPWGFLNSLNLSPCLDSGNLFADSNIIKILFPVRTIEHCGNLKDDFVREIKIALKILNIREKRNRLKEIFNEYGKFVITKFTIGGAITIDCSKVNAKSVERLQTYLYWAVNCAKGESQPIFELTSLDNFLSFETFPSRHMEIVKDLNSWVKDVYDCKNVAIISYEDYKPSYDLLDNELKHEIFECFSFRPTNQNLPKLIPQLPAEYKQKIFSEWISKSSLLLRVHDLIEKLSLQYEVFLSDSKLGYGKKITTKILKEPNITLENSTTISFINSQNRQITYSLPVIDKFDETSYCITPFNYSSNYSLDHFQNHKKICCQIKYNIAKISLDLSTIIPTELYNDSFIYYGNYYSQILPKTFYIGSTLTTTNETCDIPDIPNKVSQEMLPERIEQLLKELRENYNINTTSFLCNDGRIINQNQIRDWLENIQSNLENLEIISFEDWNPSYRMLSQLREDIGSISDNEYQIVFNEENLISQDNQNNMTIKFPHPLINDNYHIYGYILEKSDNLEESWEKTPAAITFDQTNKYGCNVIIHKNNNLKFKQDATKIKWFVIDKSDEFNEDNYTNSKVTCGRLDIDGSQNEIFIMTNNIKANYVLATSFVHKSQSDTTKEFIEEKITLNWCVIDTNGKDLKNQCGVILDNDSRKEYDDLIDYEQNNLRLSDTTDQHHRQDINFSKIFNLGSFLYLDKNSKGNEWVIQIDIAVTKSLANRDRSKDIKARNAYALKLPINAPTLNTLSERNLKKLNLLDFLYRSIKQNQEQLFLDAMRFHGLDNHLIDHDKLQTYTTSIKSLSFSPIYYYWALSKFKSVSSIASLCFKDILETRISIDIKRQNSDEILNGIQTEIEIACNIYNTYCNMRNFFLPIYMNSISLVSDDDILGPLFKSYLPKIFKIPESFQFPLPIIELENDVFPPLPLINDDSKGIEENEESYEQKIQEWSVVLKRMKHDIDTRTNEETQITQEFRTYLREFVADADIELN